MVDNVVIVHLSNFLIGWSGKKGRVKGVDVGRFNDLG